MQNPPMASTSTNSPSKSYHDKLSWFFGPAIQSLDITRAPDESDVVKICMYVFDNFKSESKDDNAKIKEVYHILIDYYLSQDNSLVLKPELTIFKWIKRVFERARKYEFRLHKSKQHINDMNWISQEKVKSGFSRIVDLGAVNPMTPSPSPLLPKRKFFDESNKDEV